MQDKSNEFDLIIRSMLEDAEVKPSRSVWKGISAQLDAASESSYSKRYSPWGWAYAGLAFAAALALFLFFSPSQQEDILYKSSALQAQKAEIQLLPIDECRPLLALARVVEEEEDEAGVFASATEVLAEEETGEKEAQDVKPLRFRDRYRTFESDFDDDDNVYRKRVRGRNSIYVKGLIGGNDSDYSIVRGVASMAPSTTETGITELGTSSFGIPLTFGIGVRFYLLPRFSLGTGIDVSLLSRSFTGKYAIDGVSSSEAGNITHSMIYLGIPINLYYDVFESKRMKFYTYIGGEAEYCVSNKYTLHTTPKLTNSSIVHKPMFSVAAGIGVEFGLGKYLGLYIDPGLRYYFPSDQPRSIRTERTFIVNFDAGLRFNF